VQLLVIIIFAILAAVVLYQLYAVLGRRVGRQPEDLAQAVEAARRDADLRTVPRDETKTGPLQGVAAIKARDPAFDVSHFLGGARKAYEMIVRAFAEGDRDELKPLLSAGVYKSFEAAISAREAKGDTETVEFIQPPRADLEEAILEGDVATAKVRFLAEQRTRSKGAEGEAVEDRRTAEVWSFERNLANRDPNWILVRVEAAPEA
jgi:predicted lipid-binding transport protein (Tim44 family)